MYPSETVVSADGKALPAATLPKAGKDGFDHGPLIQSLGTMGNVGRGLDSGTVKMATSSAAKLEHAGLQQGTRPGRPSRIDVRPRRLAVWKSNSELVILASMACNLHAIEQMQLRERRRVDGWGIQNLISTQRWTTGSRREQAGRRRRRRAVLRRHSAGSAARTSPRRARRSSFVAFAETLWDSASRSSPAGLVGQAPADVPAVAPVRDRRRRRGVEGGPTWADA